MSLAEDAKRIYLETLREISPETIIQKSVDLDSESGILHITDKEFAVAGFRGIYVIGFGKASVPMAKALETKLGNLIIDGVIITNDKPDTPLKQIQVFQGSHPLPDKQSISSAYEIVKFADRLPVNSLVINLISGGTSALFALPEDPIDIDDIREMHNLLIKSGARIQEINTVRIALSDVKGGKFLQRLKNKTVIDLVVSDVPGDELKYIGSGPTIPQKISYQDAFRILKKYKLWEETPHAVRALLGKKMDAELKQNVTFETEDFDTHSSRIIASASGMAKKASEIAKKYNYKPVVAPDVWTGPISELEQKITADFNAVETGKEENLAYIYYGECTVHVTGNGLGGRNQELALRVADTLAGSETEFAFLSGGSDGIDGPTDAAGAIVTNLTKEKAEEKSLNTKNYLKNNDSYNFFDKAGGHLKPGPTGNNLMDLQILLIST